MNKSFDFKEVHCSSITNAKAVYKALERFLISGELDRVASPSGG